MKTKKMRLIISIVSLIIIGALTLILPGCTEADRVNHNLSKQANYFDCERRVTGCDARGGKGVLYIEGCVCMSGDTTNELVVTAKTGNDTYKKNYVYLNEYTLYVVEDISGTHTDPYHYKVVFDTNVAPDIEVK